MKNKKIIIVGLIIIVVLFVIISIFIGIKIIGNYVYPQDRFANQKEVERFIKNKLGLKDFQFIRFENGKYNYPNWIYKEKNSRGLEFKVAQSSSYLVNFGIHNYSFDSTYDVEILKDYINNHTMPDGDYFTTDYVGGYSVADTELFGRKGKIVVKYTDDTLEQRTKNLYKYIEELYDYNKKITGENKKFIINVNFQKESSKCNTDIEITKKERLSEFVKRVVKKVEFTESYYNEKMNE